MASVFDLFKPRKAVKKRALQAGAMQQANVDTTGMDPEMYATIGNEAVRRVSAGGVGVETRNPFAGLLKKKAKRK